MAAISPGSDWSALHSLSSYQYLHHVDPWSSHIPWWKWKHCFSKVHKTGRTWLYYSFCLGWLFLKYMSLCKIYDSQQQSQVLGQTDPEAVEGQCCVVWPHYFPAIQPFFLWLLLSCENKSARATGRISHKKKKTKIIKPSDVDWILCVVASSNISQLDW